MPRDISINAFYTSAPAQSWAGMWNHPEAEGPGYKTLEFWTNLAKLCERGLFDSIFLADTIGISDAYGGSPAAMLRSGAFCPSNDPMMVIPVMASVTKHLSFGVTGNTSYEPPFLLARRLSTLDHLTGGRLAWNVVTGTQQAGEKAMGLTDLPAHDKRYEVAEEYMDLMYNLLESCWDDDAVVLDRENGIYADPSRVHRIKFESEHFRCDGYHMSEPSPQRTPMIYAAGASGRGSAFAGKHGECALMSANDMAFAKRICDAYRQAAVNAGRTPESIKVYNVATVVVAPSQSEAEDRIAEI
jgi:FMN-dependent oxidoreductase (nitrilotriacetate monooxygenase family)